jgi:hypothetical protein
MFRYPATEVYKEVDGAVQRQVFWSQESYDAALLEGWSDERPVEPSPELLEEKPKRGRSRKVEEPAE